MSAREDRIRDDSVEQESLTNLFGTVFDLAEQLTSRISSAEVEARLQRTLNEAKVRHEAKVRPWMQYRPVSAKLAITPTVSVIIPALNEAPNLPHVLATLPPWVNEIVVVDGHSTDDTVAVARELSPRAKVITQPGRGKGDALLAGFDAATGDIIVTLDADGSTDGAEIAAFVGALVAGADFAKGSRFSSSARSDDITAIRRAGNRVLSLLVNRLFGTQFTDLSYGYSAFWAQHLDALRLQCAGFEVHTLMYIRAAKAKLKIHEIPSYQWCRISGTSNVHVGRDGWQVLKLILRERFSRKREPDRPDLPPAIIAAAIKKTRKPGFRS